MAMTMVELIVILFVESRVLSAGKGFAMHANHHNLSSLFAQLGLPTEPAAIEDFIATHRPLGRGVAIYRAPFWTQAQKTFLIEELIEDADWAGAIDELNSRLA